jgi:hypothetical protein
MKEGRRCSPKNRIPVLREADEGGAPVPRCSPKNRIPVLKEADEGADADGLIAESLQEALVDATAETLSPMSRAVLYCYTWQVHTYDWLDCRHGHRGNFILITLSLIT